MENTSQNDNTLKYKANSVIFAEGDQARFVYIVKQGNVKLIRQAGDRLVLLADIGPKEVFGEVGMFHDGLRESTAVAMTDTVVVKVKKNDISKQLDKQPDWVNDLMSTLASRLYDINHLVVEQKVKDDRLLVSQDLKEEKVLKKTIQDYMAKHKR